MTAATAMQRGRRAAEALMVDTCRITRASLLAPTTDPVTLQLNEVDPTVIYVGQCKVQQARRLTPGTPEGGEQSWTMLELEVHIPMTITGVLVDDLVVITSSIDGDTDYLYDENGVPLTDDDGVLLTTGEQGTGGLLNRQFRVTDQPAKTFMTARRLRCEEVI